MTYLESWMVQLLSLKFFEFIECLRKLQAWLWQLQRSLIRARRGSLQYVCLNFVCYNSRASTSTAMQSTTKTTTAVLLDTAKWMAESDQFTRSGHILLHLSNPQFARTAFKLPAQESLSEDLSATGYLNHEPPWLPVGLVTGGA